MPVHKVLKTIFDQRLSRSYFFFLTTKTEIISRHAVKNTLKQDKKMPLMYTYIFSWAGKLFTYLWKVHILNEAIIYFSSYNYVNSPAQTASAEKSFQRRHYNFHKTCRCFVKCILRYV